MRSGATWKHLEALGKETIKGFLVRFCLVGSASAMVWVPMRLLEIETHGTPTALKGILAASVLLLISLCWVFVTLWLSYRLAMTREQIKENYMWLRKLFKTPVDSDDGV